MCQIISSPIFKIALTVAQILIIFILPQIFVNLSKKHKFISILGPVILCYLSGIILVNLPFINWDSSLSMNISEVSVPIAIALILFSADLIKWRKLAKTTSKSFVLVMISALVSSFVVGLIFANRLPEGWKIAGMLTGCYSGGTPNLMAIGMSLKLASETIVLVNMCDMLVGGVYFLLISSVLIKIYRKFLPKFDESQVAYLDEEKIPSMEPIFVDGRKKGCLNITKALGIALFATGVAVGVAMLITGEMDTLAVILTVTTVSIALSFWKKIKEIKGTSAMGQYAVYIFSIAIGGTVDLKMFFESSPIMLLFTACVMLGAIIIHLILCKIFKIDADTAIITSTAGVYGPAFIAPVAEAMKNKHVVVSGLITGIVGYVVGNYLGLGIAYLLKFIFYLR